MEKMSDLSSAKGISSESANDSFVKRREEFKQRELDRNDKDPCYEEGQMALDCLKQHMYDKSKCVLEFENTRACKKFWNKVQWHRFFNGITPKMPEKEEWEAVKKEYSKWISN
ncbi:coiled-coil-helix-coiled-coil-helix domain-containing protein 7-like [Ostrea edulis]|uniref:coiled-coil-helix-coiled-coil-helix domain-containing protein 7-like n=1 Tax=Ostrea edulis TaxID=37623 RepID=UPI00209541F5|nr:coiled-coil-helix-coiled-coil-helix domain-containing protein 7-like [Ostrea edulis]